MRISASSWRMASLALVTYLYVLTIYRLPGRAGLDGIIETHVDVPGTNNSETQKSAPWHKERSWDGESVYTTYVFESVRAIEDDVDKSIAHRLSTRLQLTLEPITQRFEFEVSSIIKCINCEAAWYSVVTSGQSGRQLHEIALDIDNQAAAHIIRPKPLFYDIMVPYNCELERLRGFARHVRRSKLSEGVRLLVSAFTDNCDNEIESDTSRFQRYIAKLSHMEVNDIVVVPVVGQFSRAKALNALHKQVRKDAICVSMDIDMEFSQAYLENAARFVVSGISVYFPVVWSTYNPASRALIENFYGIRISDARPNSHLGSWRPYGFGMYALSGADAFALSLDETFTGWGGEDDAFYKKVRGLRNVVRMNDYSLIHQWHAKSCDGVEKLQSCIGSWASFEGSSLAILLQNGDRYEQTKEVFR